MSPHLRCLGDNHSQLTCSGCTKPKNDRQKYKKGTHFRMSNLKMVRTVRGCPSGISHSLLYMTFCAMQLTWPNMVNNSEHHTTFVMLLAHKVKNEELTSVHLECVNFIFATSTPSVALYRLDTIVRSRGSLPSTSVL